MADLKAKGPALRDAKGEPRNMSIELGSFNDSSDTAQLSKDQAKICMLAPDPSAIAGGVAWFFVNHPIMIAAEDLPKVDVQVDVAASSAPVHFVAPQGDPNDDLPF